MNNENELQQQLIQDLQTAHVGYSGRDDVEVFGSALDDKDITTEDLEELILRLPDKEHSTVLLKAIEELCRFLPSDGTEGHLFYALSKAYLEHENLLDISVTVEPEWVQIKSGGGFDSYGNPKPYDGTYKVSIYINGKWKSDDTVTGEFMPIGTYTYAGKDYKVDLRQLIQDYYASRLR